MKNNFFLEDDFLRWVKVDSNLTMGTAKSYKSYVLNAVKLVPFTKENSNEEWSLFKILNNSIENDEITVDIDEIINLIITQLSIAGADKLFGKSRKTLQNYKSGLFKYLEFILNQEKYVFSNQNEFRANYSLNKISNETKEIESTQIIFSKNDLIKNFSLRIKTQDRLYEHIFYPIRIINRVFRIQNKRKLFKDWVISLLNHIKIHLEDRIIEFRELSSIIISDNLVYIVSKDGSKEKAFTYTKNEGEKEAFNVLKLSDISIDHVKPLYKILSDNINVLHNFIFLTGKINENIKEDKIKLKDLISLSSSDKIDKELYSIDTNSLLKELLLISEQTDLQLMDRAYNSSKGKK